MRDTDWRRLHVTKVYEGERRMNRTRAPSGAKPALPGRIVKINVAIPAVWYVSATCGCKIADVLTRSGAAKLGMRCQVNLTRWTNDAASTNPTEQLSNQTDNHSSPVTTYAIKDGLKNNKETDVITDSVITSAVIPGVSRTGFRRHCKRYINSARQQND